MKHLQNTISAKWSIKQGDYIIQDDDYAERHERILRKEAVKRRALRITMGVLTVGYVFYALHILAKF